MGSSQSTDKSGTASASENGKKSMYRRYQDAKGPRPINDDDILKYTGKTRSELHAWADTQPGVGKNQLAGSITVGPPSGLGGQAAAAGYGGWGPSAAPRDENRGMKFPPQSEGAKDVKDVED